jgi:hypothetical protein
MRTIPGDKPARIRHMTIVLLTLLLVAATVPAMHVQSARPSQPPPLPEISLTFEQNDSRISRDDRKSVFPWGAIDETNNYHVIWVESGALVYYNNLTSQRSSISGGVNVPAEPTAALQIAPGNRLYAAFSNNRDDPPRILFREGTISGPTVTWTAAEQISRNEEKALSAHLTVDRNGVAHIVWIDQAGGGGSYNVFYRTRAPGGVLGNIIRPRPSNASQTRPQVAVTNDGRVHIVYEDTPSKDIFYARSEGTSWVVQNLANNSRTNSNNPSITTDGTNIFVAWGEGLTSEDKDVQFRASFDGGLTFSDRVNVASGPSFAEHVNLVYSSASGRVHIVWQDNLGVPGGGIPPGEIYYREFDPASRTFTVARRLTNKPPASDVPRIAVGAKRAQVFWQDRTGDDNELSIFTQGAEITSVNQPCNAAMQIENGAATTNKTRVNLTFNSTDCPQVAFAQIGVDQEPAANAPLQQVTNNTIAVDLPTNNACVRTIFARPYRSQQGQPGSVTSDSIVQDTKVDALVTVSNPNTRGATTLQDALQNGASNGDANYTRSNQARLTIRAGAQECGSLKQLQVLDTNGNPTLTVPIANNSFVGTIPLPTLTPGLKNFTFAVTDEVGNPAQQLTGQIVYDPLRPGGDLAPPVGAPTLVSDAVLTRTTNLNNVLQTLRLSNVAVNDDLFGNVPGFPAIAQGARFWGVWIANSTTPITNPLDINSAAAQGLQWTPLEVPTASRVISNGISFDVSWSLATGLPDLLVNTNQARTVYVYVAFLDGAGNPSVTTGTAQPQFRSLRVDLLPGYGVPLQRLPFVIR